MLSSTNVLFLSSKVCLVLALSHFKQKYIRMTETPETVDKNIKDMERSVVKWKSETLGLFALQRRGMKEDVLKE